MDEGDEELVLSLLLATNDFDVDQRLVEEDRTLHLQPPLAVKNGDGICLVKSLLRLMKNWRPVWRHTGSYDSDWQPLLFLFLGVGGDIPWG